MRHLEHRTNNAHDTIILIEDGQVIGAWTTDRNDKPFSDFQAPGDLDDWDATWPDATDPHEYGDLVMLTGGIKSVQVFISAAHLEQMKTTIAQCLTGWPSHVVLVDRQFGMNKQELAMHLKQSGAKYLERVTHYDDDPGYWRVISKDRTVIELPIHQNNVFDRVAQLDVQLKGVEHPRWTQAREAFEKRHAADLERGGGWAFKQAEDEWLDLDEVPGDNMMEIHWQ